MKWIKLLARASWKWFKGLSLRGKAIVVGAIVIIGIVGSLTSEPVEETEPTEQTAGEAPTAATPRSPTPTTPAECETTEEGVALTESCFDEDWPLTVDAAVVRCVPPTSVLLRVEEGPDAGLYAVNGSAQTHHDYARELDAIWLPDPDVEGASISIGPVIRRGLELCEDEPTFDQRLFLNLTHRFDETDTLENFPQDQILGYGIGWCAMMDLDFSISETEDYLGRHNLNTDQAASVIVAAVNSLCEEHQEAISGD